ncbi:hypothetical protein BKA61DRAFT_569741 [Leptodontidium sp. MPI-SDFR-AT-0119]|nr:hypothetical protein BKA61DRAFT_569741 [Leptodontidium sp. MPI-SDFR-AT-0119]
MQRNGTGTGYWDWDGLGAKKVKERNGQVGWLLAVRMPLPGGKEGTVLDGEPGHGQGQEASKGAAASSKGITSTWKRPLAAFVISEATSKAQSQDKKRKKERKKERKKSSHLALLPLFIFMSVEFII